MQDSNKFSMQTKKACIALQKHEQTQTQNQTSTNPLAQPAHKHCWLTISATKMSGRTSLKPIRLQLPHPFRLASDDEVGVCLLVKDPQRTYKDAIKPLAGLDAVKKIMGVSKLTKKFKPYEAKRNLCGSFDLFLADASIIPILPKLLGKTFFQKKKQPIAVDLTKATSNPTALIAELKDAIECTCLFVGGGGACTSVRVGRIGQDAGELTANIEAVVRQLAKKFPGGIENIKSLHLKTSDSASLPIYMKSSEGSKADAAGDDHASEAEEQSE